MPARFRFPVLMGLAFLLAGLALSSEPLWQERQIQRLVAFEDRLRKQTDFFNQVPGDQNLGPDPWDLIELPQGRFATCLRGRDAIVVTDTSSTVIQELPAPAGVTSLASVPQGFLAVGSLDKSLWIYRAKGDEYVLEKTIEIPGSVSLVDVAVRDNLIAVADGLTSTLTLFDGDQGTVLRTLELPARPQEVRLFESRVFVLCPLDHQVVAYSTRSWNPQVIEHRGPLWSMDVLETETGFWLALGGVEDTELDRSQGFFGYIDSFLYLYRMQPRGAAELALTVNLSELGVVTPKVLKFSRASGPQLDVWGYGGFERVTFAWSRMEEDPSVRLEPWPPGTQAAVHAGGRWITANPLLDGWVSSGETPVARTIPDSQIRSPESRLGEALFFTELMAPHNETEGARSRFTCETCHLEGQGDGRVHFTGRHDVFAATKTLRGLFNNRPYFSRALDETMAEMIHNEFRVANAGSPLPAWFSLNPVSYSGMEFLAEDRLYEALELRQALLVFLRDFTHPRNPYTAGRIRFTEKEAKGAGLFREHCESCHQARLVTDEPGTRLPFEQWEAAIFGGGGIVWATDSYARTGIQPYVHEDGARVPSLRGAWFKSPLFTNGSARSLREAVNTGPDHDSPSTLSGLEKEALTLFLKLL